MYDVISETVIENGRVRVSMNFEYVETIERVQARIAMINHNLSPLADSGSELLSWTDHRDEAFLKFSMNDAVSKVVQRLKAWSVELKKEKDKVIIILEMKYESRKFNDLIFRMIEDIIYYGTLAAKLTFSEASLREPVGELRNEAQALSDSILIDLVCMMSIVE